jgi:hypothetical protein
MVLAHQYLGQLEPKLQEAFAANTAIKFAGGVSAKDARSLAPMLYTQPDFIESQGKGSFASHIRGRTKHAVPLTFPFGYLEGLPRMLPADSKALRSKTRDNYAVHHSQIDGPDADGTRDDSASGSDPEGEAPNGGGPKPKGPKGGGGRASEVPRPNSQNAGTQGKKDNGGNAPGYIDTDPGKQW